VRGPYQGYPARQAAYPGDKAFRSCEKLGAINLPNTLTSIGYSAFEDYKALAAVTIPASVTSIGSSAFEGCKKLQTVAFAEGSLCTSIRVGLFLE
jgi:hypothetical protein